MLGARRQCERKTQDLFTHKFTHRINILEAKRAHGDRLEENNKAESVFLKYSKISNPEY